MIRPDNNILLILKNNPHFNFMSAQQIHYET